MVMVDGRSHAINKVRAIKRIRSFSAPSTSFGAINHQLPNHRPISAPPTINQFWLVIGPETP